MKNIKIENIYDFVVQFTDEEITDIGHGSDISISAPLELDSDRYKFTSYVSNDIKPNGLVIRTNSYIFPCKVKSNGNITWERKDFISLDDIRIKSKVKTITEGRKFDSGKPRWGLLPFRELKEVVEILTFGAEKYAENNWQKVKPTSRYIDAAFRHFTAWCSGEKIDPESGKSHLAHAVCNLLFLMWFDNEEK